MRESKQNFSIEIEGKKTVCPLYDATKSFLATFSENLWLEVRDKGMKIQALCPGLPDAGKRSI